MYVVRVSLFILMPFHSRDDHRSLQSVHYNLYDLRRRPIIVAGRGCLVFIFCLRRFRRHAFEGIQLSHDIEERRVSGRLPEFTKVMARSLLSVRNSLRLVAVPSAFNVWNTARNLLSLYDQNRFGTSVSTRSTTAMVFRT